MRFGALLVPGLLVLVTANAAGRGWDTWLMWLLIPYTAIAIGRYLTFRYRYDDEDLVIRSGFIFRNERHIPYSRIQNVDAVQNVFHRLLGVVVVRVHTGGTARGRGDTERAAARGARRDAAARAAVARSGQGGRDGDIGVQADEGRPSHRG